MKIKLFLFGHYSGRSCILGGVRFINGETELEGEMRDILSLSRYLGKCYQAFPRDSDEYNAGMKDPSMVTIYGEHKHCEDHSTNTDEDVSCESAEPTGGESSEEDCLQFVASDQAPISSPSGVSDGSGHEDSGVPVRSALAEAVYALDRNDDDNWTHKGQPTVAAVAAALGREDVTRADIDDAVGAWNRDLPRADDA